MAFITVADVRAHSSLTVDANDSELSGFVDAACQVVEDLAGPIESRTVTGEVVDMVSRSTFVLRNTPVRSISSAATQVGGVSYASGLFTFNPATGIAYLSDGSLLGGQLVVTYVAGYVTPPVWASMAAAIIALHLATSQRASSTRSGVPNDSTPISGYLIPNQAFELLKPHLKAAGVA